MWMTCKYCLKAEVFFMVFFFSPSFQYIIVIILLFIKDINEVKNNRNGKEAKIADNSSSSIRNGKRTSIPYNAWMMTNNRRRKQVKRCSGANLSLERTSALSISFIGLLLLKVNEIMRACKRRWYVCVYIYIYIKDEMLTRLSC